MTMFYLVYTPLSIVGLAILIAAAVWLRGKRIPVGHVTAAEVDLTKSPEEVYALIADVPGHDFWAPRVRLVTPSGTHEGKPAFKMVVDHHTFDIFIAAAEPPRSFSLTILGDKMFTGTWTWDITRTPTGCTVRLTERGQIFSPLARGMLRLFGMEAKFLLLNLSGLAKHFKDTAKPRRVA